LQNNASKIKYLVFYVILTSICLIAARCLHAMATLQRSLRFLIFQLLRFGCLMNGASLFPVGWNFQTHGLSSINFFAS